MELGTPLSPLLRHQASPSQLDAGGCFFFFSGRRAAMEGLSLSRFNLVRCYSWFPSLPDAVRHASLFRSVVELVGLASILALHTSWTTYFSRSFPSRKEKMALT
ncbi:hypothetical protein VPH35_020060 [Triticum aestivum]